MVYDLILRTMPIFKICGPTSVLTLRLEHPIHLEENVDYGLALIGFYTDNHIRNLFQDGSIHFDGVSLPVVLRSGYWTLDTIQEHIREFLEKNAPSSKSSDFKFYLNVKRVIIVSPLKFRMDSVVSDFLGFDEPDNIYRETYTAKNISKLRAVDVIELHCELVENSYLNHASQDHKHEEASLIYQFSPNVAYRKKISEIPVERLYVPLRKGHTCIRQIQIVITDNKSRLVQNDFVNNYVYLDLKVLNRR